MKRFRVIEKKAIPELFEKVLSGEKNFDLRLNRFKCNPGNTLILREWNPKAKKYTGRIVKRKVTFVLKTKDCEKFWSKEEIDKHGFLIMALKP